MYNPAWALTGNLTSSQPLLPLQYFI